MENWNEVGHLTACFCTNTYEKQMKLMTGRVKSLALVGADTPRPIVM